nr:unnamed protein product [Leishmania braziliensis]CAJ2478384.1 unnamed protein product [Leishmania braziliensis]CAJ2478388.1 unnamed protein product [Leishmania braziliensis]
MHERQRAYSGLIDFARTIRGKGALALQCNRRIATQLYEELADVFAGIANYCAACSGDDGDGGEGHDISICYDYYPMERCSGAVSKTGARAFSCVQ